jgi:predicted phage terminase large subunit-like protein
MAIESVFRSILANDLASFIRKAFAEVSPGESYLHNWHVDAIVRQLMRVQSEQCQQLLINQPPRSLKSICASVAFVAWLLGRDPTVHIIVVSYSADLAAELHRQFRLVVAAPWYKALFPETHWAKETSFELVTTRGGGRLAASIGGTLTGRGASLVIIDDPLNAAEAYSDVARKKVIDWFSRALLTRINDKNTGAIIVVMQRLHEDDLAGCLLIQGGWDHLDLPAIAQEDQVIDLGHGRAYARRVGDVLHPARESREVLDRISANMGALTFAAQYLQRPAPLEGNLVKRDWFRYFAPLALPVRAWPVQIVQSWDAAMQTGVANDYSVCTTWRIDRNDAYLLDVYRGRLEYPDLRRKVIALGEQYIPNTILIEDAGPGMNLLQDLMRSMPPPLIRPIAMKPEGDKVQRMAGQTAKIEAGHIHLPRGAGWVEGFSRSFSPSPAGAMTTRSIPSRSSCAGGKITGSRRCDLLPRFSCRGTFREGPPIRWPVLF